MTLTQPITECIEACKATIKDCDESITQAKKTGNMDMFVKVSTTCRDACEKHSKALQSGDHSNLQTCVASCEAYAKECNHMVKTMPTAAHYAANATKCIEACRKAEGPVKA